MKSKSLVIIVVLLASIIILAGACSAGFIAGRFILPPTSQTAMQSLLSPTASPENSGAGTQSHPVPPNSTQPAGSQANSSASISDQEQLFRPFWQAWDLVHQEYVKQPVDDVALMRGAIKGMLSALGDEHTSYLDPDLMQHFNAELNGEAYEGIGAWVDTGGAYLTVISPMPGSPAEKADLKSGDQFIAIDGEDMTGIDPELARQRVLGPQGTTVVLTIQRAGIEKPFDVSIKRASIIVPTLESKMLENNIAYIHLFVFGDATTKDLRTNLKELIAQKPSGLILDLRNNGGGYLDTAIEVASEFIGNGTIMYEEYGDGTRQTFVAMKGGLATDIPMVVLINEGSASASEIVAGAIQDRQRAKLVGMTSFGKGSVQSVIKLIDDQGEVHITSALWLTPNGRQINKVGLEPDYKIEITEEDINANRDSQLQKAIELLSGK